MTSAVNLGHKPHIGGIITAAHTTEIVSASSSFSCLTGKLT